LGAFKVESHSLEEDGTIEEYYVIYKGEEIALSAEEVKVTKMREHQHLKASKKKKK
jgi:hypothetical protein|tara:strand:+ start:380 stop:547 length:168 start_codon:yes stop_codon:yes gene_type:complete